jgi:hypothetical protein
MREEVTGSCSGLVRSSGVLVAAPSAHATTGSVRSCNGLVRRRDGVQVGRRGATRRAAARAPHWSSSVRYSSAHTATGRR